MSMLLKDKISIVTGGGSGIGAASAKRFADEGAAVVVADIRKRKAEEVATSINDNGGHAIAIEVDVSDSDSVSSLIRVCVEEYGGLDVMYNNAGTLLPGNVVDLEVADWDLVMAVNVRSVFLGGKFAVPEMLKRGGGSVINTASISGMHGDGSSVSYAASKAAVINLTRAMSTDHASQGIRVNAICPVAGETPLLASFIGGDTPTAREKFIASIPLGRFSTPEDIAATALYLSSDDAAMITGVALEVDGGRCI